VVRHGRCVQAADSFGRVHQGVFLSDAAHAANTGARTAGD
jgi:hypothetical protein